MTAAPSAEKPALAVWPAQVFFIAQAEQLAATLQLPLLLPDAGEQQRGQYRFLLTLDAAGLALCQGRSRIAVDFAAGANHHRRLHGGGRGQPVARAIGLKSGNITPRVLDCTAGLGRDAFVLAALGCELQLLERSPLVHALLADGLQRACRSDDGNLRDIAGRMALLRQADAVAAMADLAADARPDVIYLDPMFPERRKQAAVKKDMAAFHLLLGGDDDADRLLPCALQLARCRVVVKRPRHAPWLADEKPGLCLEGESTRFDIYPLRSMATGAGADDL